ncbi:MAG TPA: sulfatase-like hydrolase/transferase [Solirubrobacterales bacterium]|nr:sulfatase-like hydrolase/transferase [Solirubrobacterales bacterium]
MSRAAGTKPPNVLLLLTDQQRRPRHWPDEPGWIDSLMPNCAELERTGLTFRNAFCNSSMCSPSRASLFTSRFPAEHGVELTLTAADLRPDPRNMRAVAGEMAQILRRREAPPRRVLTQFTKGLVGLDRSTGHEAELPTSMPSLPSLLRERGYEVAYKGKWHLTHPLGGADSTLGGWSERDAARIERDYGFADWEAPDAGENARAEHFGGGLAGEGEGWDEVYTSQVERWLGRADLPEPFCLVVSLVNPHDVLGYPASYVAGGYAAEEFRELGVRLPPTVDEVMIGKPAVHSLMRMGMTAYMGPLDSRRRQLDYVNFYAYLHRLVDAKIGRVLAALGDPGDPGSLRSRTVVARCADHGEMGLSHGGLRQKAFNAYEETINVPLVISNPVLFPRRAETDALGSLVDVLPTLLELSGRPAEAANGLKGRSLVPVLAARVDPERERVERSPVDLAPVLGHEQPSEHVREAIHFTYDDHQAATAQREAPGHPNRVRAIRTTRHKYAFYFDPDGERPREYEMYDLERDPDEVRNLVGVRSGRVLDPVDGPIHAELVESIGEAMNEAGTEPAPATEVSP